MINGHCLAMPVYGAPAVPLALCPLPFDLLTTLQGRSGYSPISQMGRLRLREVRGSLKGIELGLGPGPSDSSTPALNHVMSPCRIKEQ